VSLARSQIELAARRLLVILNQMRASLLSAALLVAVPVATHAGGPSVGAGGIGVGATGAVRGYFQALDRQDFVRALALTDGQAQESTSNMVNTLKRQAAAAHAWVEVKVKTLEVQPEGVAEPGRGVPVPVHFHIDVIGHKWLFHKVGRRLDGYACFWVDPERADRIVAIEGDLK
jgi:hypothetical protein